MAGAQDPIQRDPGPFDSKAMRGSRRLLGSTGKKRQKLKGWGLRL